MTSLKRILRLDWDAAAGIIAAVAALVMHFLHVIDEEVLLTIAVVLMALLFLRELRREPQTERMAASLARTEQAISELHTNLRLSDVRLCGPKDLVAVSEAFSAHARGDMIWFHVCLSMFRPQALFDTLLRPALENPAVRSIQFVLDSSQQSQWERDVVPKLDACRGKDKMLPPMWTSVHEHLSLILSDAGSNGKTECLLSFWGEPFMASTAGREVPRYIFHVQSQSELVDRLIDLVRAYRVAG